ncbi:prolyl oligopeptidase family serine peptidase [Pelomonas sp. CA6]|uniref:alpha/beta hydrolase family protein n=1 Tax=Pelomonas sp. CA6 TaxID=2907999 RepID=UPI001F4A690D|nr:prolyl oligopeptidase family serine peptidase [Pelomonas sp. CA6]MCH7342040.1 prolyl oligopeptidase family serine peptidase [Pelomonas sp. CA6]
MTAKTRRWRRLRLLGTALALMAGALAQPALAQGATEPVALEQFFQHPAVLDVKLSPSGRQIALTTSAGSKRVSLYVVELGDTPKPKRAAAFSDVDVVRFDWVGDERLVFSVVDLEAGSGEDQRLAPGLYSVAPDGQELRTLVRRYGTPFVSNGERNRSLEWNHLLLSVPRAQPDAPADEVVIGVMKFEGKSLAQITPLWLNVRTGRTRAMDIRGAPDNIHAWMFDSRGNPRAAISSTNGREIYHWRGAGDEGWRELSTHDSLRRPFSLHSVDDKGTLYVTRSTGAGKYSTLTTYDFAAGKPSAKPLVSTPGFDFTGTLLLERSGDLALGVRLETDAEQTLWFDAAMKRFQAEVDERLPGRVNRVQCVRCGANDMVALVRSFSDQDPGTLWLYEAASKRWQPISQVLKGIDPRRMASVDFQRIRARDGLDLPVWITLPPSVKPGTKPERPLPAVVMVHGGPWVRGGHWRWSAMEQFLASRGYLVISPEFRGSTGYGWAHYQAGWKQWGQTMQDDVTDALKWAQAQGLADRRACIAGASYGGYATLMGLVRDPELYRCGIAWVGVADLKLLIQGSGWIGDDVSEDARRYGLPVMVGDPDKDAEMIQANSPVEQAARIKAPLLLAYGAADVRVPLAHGERLRSALKAAGQTPEWVVYPNEGHSWRQVTTHVDFARRVEQFLDRHLKAGAP